MCFAPNGVHFFDISTSKSGPNLVCLAHFDLETCFAPQRARTFSTSQLPKVVRSWCALYILTYKCASCHNGVLPKVVRRWCVLYILTSKCASRHNGVQLFIFHLASWLRTRRFSEVSFRPHWKHTVNCDFPTFSRTCIFLLPALSLLWSSHFLTSPPWLFPPLLFHLCILSEVWLLNFLRLGFASL